jgi:hypothetical protein
LRQSRGAIPRQVNLVTSGVIVRALGKSTVLFSANRVARLICAAIVCFCMAWGCVPPEESDAPRDKPPLPPPDKALNNFLAYYDDRYDDSVGLVAEEFVSVGYHSQLPTGARVFPTRESLVYAIALLRRDGAGDAARAARIIEEVLAVQDADPRSPTFGVWPWHANEPIAEMSSPDSNWADFCGAAIAQLLIDHADQLPNQLKEEMRQSLRRATTAIRARNVGPGYTNIAILGAGVCVAAGELFGDDALIEYGRKRLQKVVRRTAEHGSFSEYNSPIYTVVALAECDRILQLVNDAATRQAAESLRRTAWEIIANSFHPGTQQWAGPHSRSTKTRFRPKWISYVNPRIDRPIVPHPLMEENAKPSLYAVVVPTPCPDDLLDRFEQVGPSRRHAHNTYIRGASARNAVTGVTWMNDEACLGSVNHATMWTQRKPLIAYWKTDDDPAVAFRVRFLHEGKDFASMGIRNCQQGPRVLSLFHSVPGQGDWHPSLDKPSDGAFSATDLRVRFELLGSGAIAEELGDNRFALAAGDYRVVIHACPGRLGDHEVVWQLGREDGVVFLDGIAYRGDERAFDFSKPIDLVLSAGIELLSPEKPIAKRTPVVEQSDGTIKATWRPATELPPMTVSTHAPPAGR